ncbi:MAG: tetratricopeptide repeat protein [Candidatus Sumerlaeaceae bacterium]
MPSQTIHPDHQKIAQAPAGSSARRLSRIVLLIVAFLGSAILFRESLVRYTAEVTASEADTLTKRQLYSQAKEMAELSIRQNPYNGYAYYYLGYAELLLERRAEAIAIFDRARPFMPHLTQLLKMLAQAYYFANDFEKAVATFDEYLAMEPLPRVGQDNIFRLWAQALSRTQQFGRATIALAQADSFPTYRNELLQTRILNAVLLNQIIMADYYYREFKHNFHEKSLEPTALFIGALAAKKMESLIRFLELNRLRGEMDATTEKILAMGYAKQGRLSEAITVLLTAQRFAPNDPEIPLFLGDAYSQLGDKAKAKDSYRRHLDLAPASAYRKELLRYYPELEREINRQGPTTDVKENLTSVPAQQP